MFLIQLIKAYPIQLIFLSNRGKNNAKIKDVYLSKCKLSMSSVVARLPSMPSNSHREEKHMSDLNNKFHFLLKILIVLSSESKRVHSCHLKLKKRIILSVRNI